MPFKQLHSILPQSVLPKVISCDGKAACFRKLMNAKSQASIGVCSRRVSWKTRLSGLAFSASNKLDLEAERLRQMPTHSNSSASTALQLALYTVETKRSSLICLESDGCLMRDCQSSTSGAFSQSLSSLTSQTVMEKQPVSRN